MSSIFRALRRCYLRFAQYVDSNTPKTKDEIEWWSIK